MSLPTAYRAMHRNTWSIAKLMGLLVLTGTGRQFIVGGVANRVQTVNYTWRGAASVRISSWRVSRVGAAQGASVVRTGGGVGTNNLSLRMTTARGRGLNYLAKTVAFFTGISSYSELHLVRCRLHQDQQLPCQPRRRHLSGVRCPNAAGVGTNHLSLRMTTKRGNYLVEIWGDNVEPH
ncbi:unnamed protein product [Chilo suppressalis]|uniref:Uncharacterized protein n=1 Tax=Chilo suppressalis TaxID=168631 RepID=A0ABN8B928_CHISP|nr:unnamed protein product [Chilo suppressalis]